jgi:dTDP-glucose 4,6-dehydratase
VQISQLVSADGKRKRPILVTGGAGFIGSNFIRTWLDAEDAPIVNLDKLTYAGNLENLSGLPDARHEFVHGDIGDLSVVKGVFARAKPRAVVNLAAESHVDRSIHGPEDFIRTNVVGTFRLIECARDYWQHLHTSERNSFRFVHVSTDEVYGSLLPGESPFRETTAFQPISPYAASKAASDHLVRAWHHTYGLPVITTNCLNNYGPFQSLEKLIPLMLHNAVEGRPLPIYGDGLQVRDWLYVDDHCAAIRTIFREGKSEETYNIGGGNEKTNLDVVHAICDILQEEAPRADGRSYRHQIAFVKDRPGHDRRYAIDDTKIGNELNWRPSEGFESGLRRTIKWYLANRDWRERVASGSYRDWIQENYSKR